MSDLKLEFEAPIGQRLYRYFYGVTLMDGPDLWWYPDLRTWEPINAHPELPRASHAECRTVRSFKRMLRKHPHIQGHATLVNHYVGYNVKG